MQRSAGATRSQTTATSRDHCNTSASFCDGAFHPRVCRGRLLSEWAALAITIYPIDLEAPAAYRVEVKSFVPLWGTIEAIADSGGYVMTEEEWMARRVELAEEWAVPLAEVNLDRRVHGPGVTAVLKDPIGNVVLFMPLGFLAAVGWAPMRDPRRVLLAGAAVSGGIELSQMLFGLGSLGTIDDVIFNSLGALAGWVPWRVTVDVAEDLRSGLW